MNAKLLKVVKELHLIKMGNPYQNRKIVQCTVYLIQRMGVEMDYDDFTLKACGIHSNKLSQDMTEMYPKSTLTEKTRFEMFKDRRAREGK